MRGRGHKEVSDHISMTNRKLDEALAVIVGKNGQDVVAFEGVIDQFSVPRKWDVDGFRDKSGVG